MTHGNNVYERRWALIGLVDALPQPECWPAHYLEHETLHTTGVYCWTCLERILKRLLARLGDGSRSELHDQGWNWGQDNETTVPEDCRHCGRPLIQHLDDDGIGYELDHFESLTDEELPRTQPHEIARLLGQARKDAVSIRAFRTVERYLTLRGVPLPALPAPGGAA